MPSAAPEDLQGGLLAGRAGGAPTSGGAPTRRRSRAAWVGGAVLLFHAAVAAWALWPARAPDEQLAAAARERFRSEREARLRGLGASEAASAEQLARAAELLLEVDGFTTLRTVARDFQRVAPTDLRGLLWEARAELELQMIPEALAALDRASRLAPGDARPLLLRAELHERAGELDLAVQALQEAQVVAERPELGLRLGGLLRRAGRLEEAAQVLSVLDDRALAGRTRSELGLVRYQQGRLDEARALLTQALALDPDDPGSHHALGAVLHALGEPRAAESSWRRAAALEPDEPRHLAALCELLGRDATRGREAGTLAHQFKRRFPTEVARIGGACLTPHPVRPAPHSAAKGPP